MEKRPSFRSQLQQFFFRRPPNKPPTDLEAAKALVAAIDAGGIPLNPAVVSHIARNLGLEVSRKAPVEQTIERIRQAVQRAGR